MTMFFKKDNLPDSLMQYLEKINTQSNNEKLEILKQFQGKKWLIQFDKPPVGDINETNSYSTIFLEIPIGNIEITILAPYCRTAL